MNKSYLTFKIGEELFAANVSMVSNILEMIKITVLPKAPYYLKGVINLRGTVLPVVDIKEKFELGETEHTTNTCILVLELIANSEQLQIGAIVDSVQEVIEIEENKIQNPPTLGNKYKEKFITGMVEYNEDFIMIIDMNYLFTSDEAELLAENQQIEETI